MLTRGVAKLIMTNKHFLKHSREPKIDILTTNIHTRNFLSVAEQLN